MELYSVGSLGAGRGGERGGRGGGFLGPGQREQAGNMAAPRSHFP